MLLSNTFLESDDESERKVQNKVVENENENRDVKRGKPYVYSESMLDEFLS